MNDLMNRTSLPVSRPAQFDYVLLDASGSMISKWHDCLAAIDTYVSSLRTNNVNTSITLATFSTTYNQGDQFSMITWRDSVAPDAWTSLNDIGMEGGGTPLYDAINSMGRILRDLNPAKCSALICTDGGDTDSKTSVEQARRILDWMRAKGWQVTFFGCDFNNNRQALALGATPQNAIGVSQARLSDAASALAKKRQAYSSYGSPMNFTDDEKQEFGGYLSAK